MAFTGGRVGGRASSLGGQSSCSYGWRRSCPWRTSTYIYPSHCCSASSYHSGHDWSSWEIFSILMFFIAVVVGAICVANLPASRLETSVLRVQIGFLDTAPSLQKNLNEITRVSNTSTREGLSNVLTETVVTLLRRRDYVISGYSSVDVKRSSEEAETLFNKFSISERMKYDEETLVNVQSKFKDGGDRHQGHGNYEANNGYIVVTVLAEAGGRHKLPEIHDGKDLEEALEKLGAIPHKKLNAAEVIWTPQKPDDRLSRRELIQDFPHLKPLNYYT